MESMSHRCVGVNEYFLLLGVILIIAHVNVNKGRNQILLNAAPAGSSQSTTMATYKSIQAVPELELESRGFYSFRHKTPYRHIS